MESDTHSQKGSANYFLKQKDCGAPHRGYSQVGWFILANRDILAVLNWHRDLTNGNIFTCPTARACIAQHLKIVYFMHRNSGLFFRNLIRVAVYEDTYQIKVS